MKNVLILGAGGNIATHVTDILANNREVNLTLFVRNARRLRSKVTANCRVVEGDVLNYNQLKAAMSGQAIVFACLPGRLGKWAGWLCHA